MFYVYIHCRATDGKPFYVGKGQGRRAHSTKDRNKHWRHVDAKHGRDLRFIDANLTEDRAFELEGFLIDFIGRADLGRGPLVNMTDGGEGHAGYCQSQDLRDRRGAKLKGLKRTPEQRASMSASMKGIPKSAEHREKIRQSMLKKGVNPAFRLAGLAALRGRVLSAESRAKIKANQPHARKVICVETGQVFENLEDAAKWARSMGHEKASKSAICGVCAGRSKKAYGRKWEYA